MYEVFAAVVLGIVEGLTEFLPVSSTGHMILAAPLLGIRMDQPPWRATLWISQFGAILAVVAYFRVDLWRRVFAPPAGQRGANHLLVKLTAAMVPTVVLALLFKDYLDPLENSPTAVAIALIVGAVVMELIDRLCRRDRPQELGDVTLAQAIGIGAIQAISMVPGVSRAGATIMGGMALGLTPRVATEFSFYLAIPTMLAATLKTLKDEGGTLSANDAQLILIGSAVAFVTAYGVIATFMRFVKRYRFTVFAVYRVALGVVVLWLCRPAA